LPALPPLPTIDLFAGAGGLSLGLGRAGLVPVAASEMDEDSLRTYTAAHGRYHGGTPLRVFDGDVARHSFTSLRGEVAVVAGGPPCQPYSLGGLRLGGGDRRDGLPQFVRAVREIGPEAFLMENVPGLASGAQVPRLRALLAELADLGFEVGWRVLHAADYGVPQRRQRLLIVGTRRPGFTWPVPTHGVGAPRPWVRAGCLLDAGKPFGEPNLTQVTYARNPDLRPSPWDGHLWNGGGRPINPAGLAPTLLASMGGNKTPWLDGGDVVARYHAHLAGGGLPRAGVVPGARRITAEEAAVIQTLPPDMPWAGRRSSRYRQIGNAVPVRLAQAVGEALSAHLHGVVGSRALVRADVA
jgi:DNA (cytosine-5)-methyltransferase 1